MQKIILTLISGILFLSTKAQVNMPSGTMNFAIPIHSYADNLSKLSFKAAFLYNSGNGLEVDNVSNSIGTKWAITGIPVVTRNIKGLPDDQIERPGNVFDLTKYPPGYLYNNKSIDLGCPTALSKYPIFEDQGVWSGNDNVTESDRELDEFYFMLNETSGSFVIDKNFNAVQLNDSRNKIEIFIADQTVSKNIRTSIVAFHITDENGIKYIFSEQETNKVFRISELNPDGSWTPASFFSKSYEIPLSENPYITTGWYVSKIIDTKTNREISFFYNTTTNVYEYKGQLQTQLRLNYPDVPVSCVSFQVTTPTNQTYTVGVCNTKGAIIKKELKKKEISLISFPDYTQLSFNYLTDRKDLGGTKMLDKIEYLNAQQSILTRYELNHSYFIKNEIRDPVNTEEEKWARLCLKEIKKTGTNSEFSENPWKFEYYTGSNAIEDFVPPYFFHAKDPWGFYNGNYAGVTTTNFLNENDEISWAKVCLYNQGHGYPGGIDISYNSKAGYAKNGLIKTIVNPFGGKIEYQFEQNYFNGGTYLFSWDTNASGIAVGGVHISKTIEKSDNNPANDLHTEYSYNDEQGFSTLWGEEMLTFQANHASFWYADGKYFTGTVCKYRYKYPGKVFTTNQATDDFKKFLSLVHKGYNTINTINKLASLPKLGISQAAATSIVINTAINLVLQYVLGIVISCETPAKLFGDITFYNNNVNTNLLPRLYKTVTKKQYTTGGLLSGKTVFEFTSPLDFPLILPNVSSSFDQKARSYSWMYGLSKSVKLYDNADRIIKSTENEYELKKQDVQDLKTRSCNCETFWQQSLRADQWNSSSTFNEFTDINTSNTYGIRQKVDFYNIVKGHSELKRTTEKLYDHANTPLTSTVNYYYNPVNFQLSSQVSTNSKNATIETKNFYIENYNLNNPSNTILNQMKNDNILNIPVSTETWQTKPGGTPEMLSTSVTEFGTAPNGDYKPVKTYGLETDRPVPQSAIGVFNPNQLIRDANLIKQQTELYYDAFGNQVSAKDVKGNRIGCTLFGYGNMVPVVSVNNASVNEIAFTSFESNDAYNNPYSWNWGNGGIGAIAEDDLGAPTGNRRGTGSNSFFTSIPMTKDYILSFWSEPNKYTLNYPGLNPKISGPTINGWTYYEYHIPAGYYSPRIDGSGKIDEIRLYPKNASMLSTTYNPDYGKTSECDINNRITYYEYDGLGRMSKVLDERHNIIKTYEYHFKN